MIKYKNNILQITINFNRIKCNLLGHNYIYKIGKYQNGEKFKIGVCSNCCYIKYFKED